MGYQINIDLIALLVDSAPLRRAVQTIRHTYNLSLYKTFI